MARWRLPCCARAAGRCLGSGRAGVHGVAFAASLTWDVHGAFAGQCEVHQTQGAGAAGGTMEMTVRTTTPANVAISFVDPSRVPDRWYYSRGGRLTGAPQPYLAIRRPRSMMSVLGSATLPLRSIGDYGWGTNQMKSEQRSAATQTASRRSSEGSPSTSQSVAPTSVMKPNH